MSPDSEKLETKEDRTPEGRSLRNTGGRNTSTGREEGTATSLMDSPTGTSTRSLDLAPERDRTRSTPGSAANVKSGRRALPFLLLSYTLSASNQNMLIYQNT
jgi:hypothetical protein